MRKPDHTKMRLMLCKNESAETQEYIMSKMEDGDVLYQFIKAFGNHEVPKKEVKWQIYYLTSSWGLL